MIILYSNYNFMWGFRLNKPWVFKTQNIGRSLNPGCGTSVEVTSCSLVYGSKDLAVCDGFLEVIIKILGLCTLCLGYGLVLLALV